ncbi:enolase C-terminal domain-like protein [Nocardioides daejeonensis]|uniref:enolase C-terminal domain-like protein n=1 Tax=Nocardioides daejeonensis TaxID=1046556 RepID=UPI000D747607|nr:enolase C-terminal domain-like protein [Nocardioides daejeonensis]
MKIIDVRATQLKSPDYEFKWKDEWEGRRIGLILLRIIGEDGHEGHCITWLVGNGQMEDSLPRLKKVLVGRDPHDVEAISYELSDSLTAPTGVSSAVDIALWDLIGKHHETPVYKLLGAARHRVRAYASTVWYPEVQDYVDLALQCRDEGFTAYKLHAFGTPDKDIEVCRAVREAVGDTMDLMLDPVNSYDRHGAFKVGRVLEELDFYWYEAPIKDTDIDGLVDLTRSLDIQVAGAESVMGGLKFLPQYVTRHAVDQIRGIGDFVGGISAMKKAASMCEAFGINYEPHSYGHTLIQAAHFNVMLAIHNCDLVELPVPTGILDQGMKDTLRVNAEGFVDAPTKPGLGYEIDEDEIDNMTIRELAVGEFSTHLGS